MNTNGLPERRQSWPAPEGPPDRSLRNTSPCKPPPRQAIPRPPTQRSPAGENCKKNISNIEKKYSNIVNIYKINIANPLLVRRYHVL